MPQKGKQKADSSSSDEDLAGEPSVRVDRLPAALSASTEGLAGDLDQLSIEEGKGKGKQVAFSESTDTLVAGQDEAEEEARIFEYYALLSPQSHAWRSPPSTPGTLIPVQEQAIEDPESPLDFFERTGTVGKTSYFYEPSTIGPGLLPIPKGAKTSKTRADQIAKMRQRGILPGDRRERVAFMRQYSRENLMRPEATRSRSGSRSQSHGGTPAPLSPRSGSQGPGTPAPTSPVSPTSPRSPPSRGRGRSRVSLRPRYYTPGDSSAPMSPTKSSSRSPPISRSRTPAARHRDERALSDIMESYGSSDDPERSDSEARKNVEGKAG